MQRENSLKLCHVSIVFFLFCWEKNLQRLKVVIP